MASMKRWHEEGNPKAFDTLLIEDSQQIEAEARSVQLELNPNRPPIPATFDGRVTWAPYLSPVLDQGTCGACYAYSTVMTLQDKFAIQSLGQVRPRFNPLEPVMCLIEEKSLHHFYELKSDIAKLREEEEEHVRQACSGNSLYAIGKYLFRFGAVEDSCVPYTYLKDQLKRRGQFPLCTDVEGAAQDLCQNNAVAQRGWPIWNYYTVGRKSDPHLVEDLQLDMMKWGPITMGFMIYEDFLTEYDGKTVYVPRPGLVRLGGHAVKVVGWGAEEGVPYWLCQNSWGVSWGDKGYFKIQRNSPLLMMEHNHMGVAPQLPNTSLPRAPKPYSPTIGKSKGKELLERKFYGINPVNFYPTRLISLIKDGKLKGDLKPIFDDATLPIMTDFWAYKLGRQAWATPSGKMVWGLRTPNRTWMWLLALILLGVGLCLIYLRGCA